MQSVSSYKCEICGELIASNQCTICNRIVCFNCITANGNCIVCDSLKCQICGKNIAVDKCLFCGRLMCRKCLHELDETRRICINCKMALGSEERIMSMLKTREKHAIKLLRTVIESWQKTY